MDRTVLETILHRRSIRRFDARQVEPAALEEILRAGLYAPSAGGRQGPLLAVCQDRACNERLGKCKRANSQPRMASGDRYVSREQPSIADDPKLTNAFYDAPTVVTLFGPKNFLFAAEDCAAAAENMMLAADALGGGEAAPRGFIIGEYCIGCGICAEHCPQHCIAPGQPYVIAQEHCLHCGNCLAHCPVSAVRRREAVS